MKTIFVVNDNEMSLLLAKEALENHHRVLTMSSSEKMFNLLKKITPELILLDIEMTEKDGSEALQKLKSNPLYTNSPVIFLTNNREGNIETLNFEFGVVDFISKPFSTPILLNRIKTQTDIDWLIRDPSERIKRLQNSIMIVFANMAEARDKDTVGHNDRIETYVKILIEAMKERGVYAEEINKWDIEKVAFSSRLHDMGKINILDTILNKPGKLSDEEYESIKSHTTEGEKIIDKMIKQTGEEEFLNNAKLYAKYHHEHWDGKGYPHGLKETDIPLHGRIMAIVDAYDALTSKRPYKKAYTDEEAINIIFKDSGKQFDPKIVEVLLDVQDEFKGVRNFYYTV
ncbi:HD domain-containing phosphohydrolase [Treponema sp. R6D11]